MDNNNGALSFKSTLDNEEFIGAIKEAERRVKGFSQATVKEGQKIDDAFKITAENIKIQKDVIAKAEAQIKQLNARIDKTAPGMAQNDLRKQAAQLTAELNGEKQALVYLEQQVKETEASHVSFRTQLRNVREELIQMEQAGLRGTDAYNTLQLKAGQLNDAYKDAQQQMTVLANDERGFQGVLSMMTGVTGAFSAAQGAVGLFTGENENLNRVMLKVQSLMAVTIGMQQVSQTLNKDSYFSVVVLAKAKEVLAATELKLATAFGISTAAARVFMAAVTLGLSVAITGAIVLISKFVSKQKEAAKAQQGFNSAVADTVSKPVVQIERLSLAWSKLGDDLKAKEKFIKDHSETFKALGTNVQSVADAENLLIKNKDAFILAQIAKAKALAATDKAVEIAKEQYAIQSQMETTAKTKKVINYNTGVAEEYENAEFRKLRKRNDKLQEELKKLYGDAANYELEAIETLVNAGISSVDDNINENIEKLVSGSIGAFERLIQIKQGALKQLTNPADYDKAMAEIKKLEEKLKWIRGEVTYNRPDEQLKSISGIGAADVGQMITLFDPKQLKEITRVQSFEERRKALNKDIAKSMYEQLQRTRDTYLELQNQKTEMEQIGDFLKNPETWGQAAMGLAELSDAFSGINDELSDMLAKFSDVARKAASLVEGLANKNYVQAATSAVGLITEWIKLFDTKELKEEAEIERMEYKLQLLERQHYFLSSIDDRLNEVYGVKRIDLYNNYIKNTTREMSELIDQINSETSYTAKGGYLFGLSEDELTGSTITGLKSRLGQIIAPDDSNYEYITGLLDELDELYQKRKDLINELYSSILGTTSDTISDTIAEGFDNGLTSVEDFGNDVKSILRKALIESFQSKYLDQQLQDWYVQFGQAASDGTLTEEEIKTNQAAMNAVITNASVAFEEYQKMIDNLGLIQTQTQNTVKDASLTGSIKGVTEETASALGGQINAIRINQAESLESMRNQLMYLSQIAANTSYNIYLKEIAAKLGSGNSDTVGIRGSGLV